MTDDTPILPPELLVMEQAAEVWYDGEWSEKYLCFGHVERAPFVAAATALGYVDHEDEEIGPVTHRWMRWQDTEPHERFLTIRGTCFGTAHPYTEAELW